MAKESTPRLRRRERKNISAGVAHVAATFNNGFYQGLGNSNYDQVGRAFRLGTRFQF